MHTFARLAGIPGQWSPWPLGCLWPNQNLNWMKFCCRETTKFERDPPKKKDPKMPQVATSTLREFKSMKSKWFTRRHPKTRISLSLEVVVEISATCIAVKGLPNVSALGKSTFTPGLTAARGQFSKRSLWFFRSLASALTFTAPASQQQGSNELHAEGD